MSTDGTAPDRHRSLWLEEALAANGSSPPLTDSRRCDVAIIGGGYVGLWTALRLKALDPALNVVVLEGDVCGGGASGRNGGQFHSWWDRVGTLVGLFGHEEGTRLAGASVDAIGELARLSDSYPEVGFRQDGWVQTATAPAQVGAWDEKLDQCESAGTQPYRVLSAEEAAALAGSEVHLGGIIEAVGGTLHPGQLARALRRSAIDAGVEVYERSPVLALHRSSPATLTTPEGIVTAARVVIATNAWATRFRELRSSLFVVSSEVVATPPIPERLEDIGWTTGAAICDSRDRVHYYHRTPEGRVIFGKGGGRIAFGGRIGARFDQGGGWEADAIAGFRYIYPALKDVPIESSWAGPIDRSPSGLPFFGRLGSAGHLIYGIGWSGSGVGQAWIGGRILASLALDRDDEWARSGLVVDRPPLFPPEPLRFLGGQVVRSAITRRNRLEDRRAATDPVTRWVSDLKPALRQHRTARSSDT